VPKLFVKAPADELIYQFDFSAEVPAGVSVSSVTIVAPAPLTVSGKTDDLPNKASKALFSGGLHGGIYECVGTATLNNGEKIDESFTLRVHASA